MNRCTRLQRLDKHKALKYISLIYFSLSMYKSPTGFLSLYLKILLADSNNTLRCSQYRRSFVTYVAWRSNRDAPVKESNIWPGKKSSPRCYLLTIASVKIEFITMSKKGTHFALCSKHFAEDIARPSHSQYQVLKISRKGQFFAVQEL